MSDDQPTEAYDIQVVVFDALVGRKTLVNQAGSNPSDFVRGHRRPDPAATNGHAPFHFPTGNRTGKGHNVIWIIILRLRLPVTEIDQLIAGFAQFLDQILL